MTTTFTNRQPDTEPTTFGQLAVGDEFFFSNYSRTGLLADLDRPGRVLYVKLGQRRYKRADNDAVDAVGRVSARVWRAKVWTAKV